MVKKRTLGVTLIAALFFLESASLIAAWAIGHVAPQLRPMTNSFIAQRAPLIHEFHVLQLDTAIALLFAIIDMAEGMGIWLLKRWARTLIVIDLVYRLGGAAVAATMLGIVNRERFFSITSTPQFITGLTINVLILACLLDPDTKRIFGVRDDEFV